MANQEFVDNFVSDVKEKNWTQAAVRFTEEVSRCTPEELGKSIAVVNQALKSQSLPELYIEKDGKSGSTKSIRLNNGLVFDSPVYNKPAVQGTALQDPKLEALAQHFEAVKSLVTYGPDYGIYDRRTSFKSAGEFLLNETAKLDKKSRYDVLKRASDLSYQRGHSLNVVFADLDGDGKTEELSDMAVNFRSYGTHSSSVERIDLYDPPAKK